MSELQARLAACEREAVELKQRVDALEVENERLQSQLVQWDPYYALRLDLPSADEALVLWKKITAKYPRMISPTDSITDQARGLVAAMAYCFSVAKSAKPVTRYGGEHWIVEATSFANKARLPAPRIRSVLIGIIATNDINFVLKNDEIYLDPFRGTPIVDRQAWRKLLDDGEPVPDPTPGRPPFSDGSIGGVRRSGVW